ncbi:MAG TPA: hypothetical protein VHN10_04990 [Candidatus Acidoferrales bacterium]|jgi:hypothetical protein|nr:hypothetical protein [Candidatus Acidoferrales bacterium]
MNDMDWYECSEARSFCDGYCVGFYTSANNGAHVESDSDHYKKGFLRGLAAKRIENLGMDVMKQARAQLREEVSRMEGYYGFQGPSQTD